MSLLCSFPGFLALFPMAGWGGGQWGADKNLTVSPPLWRTKDKEAGKLSTQKQDFWYKGALSAVYQEVKGYPWRRMWSMLSVDHGGEPTYLPQGGSTPWLATSRSFVAQICNPRDLKRLREKGHKFKGSPGSRASSRPIKVILLRSCLKLRKNNTEMVGGSSANTVLATHTKTKHTSQSLCMDSCAVVHTCDPVGGQPW